jgi:UPF0716 protein FxsA
VGALIVLALVVVPLVEIYLLIQVGQVLGALPTIALLVVMSVIGGLLLKREGTRTWRAFRSATASGRVPAKEVADGALVIFGGALMLTPGFATDVLGLLCVLPLTRPAVRRVLTGVVTARLGLVGVVGTAASSGYARHRDRRGQARPPAPGDAAGRRPAPGDAAGRRPAPGDAVVDGEVVDRDDQPPGRS